MMAYCTVEGNEDRRHAVRRALDELKDTRDANNDAVEEGLEKVLDELQDIRKDTRDLQEKFIQKKDLNWEDKRT